MTALPKISVQRLWKVFGSRTTTAINQAERGRSRAKILKDVHATVALRDVSLDIPAGRTSIVMGLSGSGKSTLVRCVNRLIEPTRGAVLIDGQDVAQLDRRELWQLRRERFGMVFQNFALLPHHNVLDNVAFGLELQGVGREERTARATKTLALVGLEGWSGAYPDELSGGMQQRVGLARALVGDPDILLMDEPFSALDPLMRTQMQDELLDLQMRLRKTIVFITHDLDEALKLGSTIAILHDGEVAQVGTAAQILREPADDYVAAFVEQVDRSRFLMARDVMWRPADLVRLGHDPRVALRMMEQEGRSASFVIGPAGQLEGLLTADAALEAALRGDIDVRAVVNRDINMVGPDEPLAALIEAVTSQPYPLAVVEAGQFKGVVARVSILRGIAERRELGREPTDDAEPLHPTF